VLPGGQIEEGDFTDVLGHGTAVMAAIQDKAPQAEYFAVKLFHSSLRTNAECVLAAIDWAINHGVDVVNLSLGTRNSAHATAFEGAVARAAGSSVLLVSAREADGQACLPGSLSGVFGVGLDWDIPRDLYRAQETKTGVAYFASGYPRSLPGVTPERNLHGISFAVANMTGFVARACEEVKATGQACSFDTITHTLLSALAMAWEAPPTS